MGTWALSKGIEEVVSRGHGNKQRDIREIRRYEKFVGTLFLFSKKKTCAKRKSDTKRRRLRKNEGKDG